MVAVGSRRPTALLARAPSPGGQRSCRYSDKHGHFGRGTACDPLTPQARLGTGCPGAVGGDPPSQTQPYSSTRMHTLVEWSVTGTKRTNRATMGGSRSLRRMS